MEKIPANITMVIPSSNVQSVGMNGFYDGVQIGGDTEE
jgi:hypothetical protein